MDAKATMNPLFRINRPWLCSVATTLIGTRSQARFTSTLYSSVAVKYCWLCKDIRRAMASFPGLFNGIVTTCG